MSDYWKNIKTAAKTLNEGLKVTMKHMKDATGSRDALYTDDQNYFEKQNGLFTTQYPKETLPVPDHGRYKLHNEIDDCIVCDKCAKVCPVNCIDIEPVRAVGEIGKTSDGTSKRIYAAKFDIDMAKCCFCGLCTTVCPTECLTMTDEFDFSTHDVAEHNFVFGEMTPLEILEKKQELEAFNKKKEEEKAAKAAATPSRPKPQMKPKVGGDASDKPKPVFRPKVPVKKASTSDEETAKAKPVIKPKLSGQKTAEGEGVSSRPKPVMRPKVVVKKKEEGASAEDSIKPKAVRPKVQAKPKIPARKADEAEETRPKPRSVIKPKIQVKKREDDTSTEQPDKPKAVRPKIQPRPKIPTRKSGDSGEDKKQGDA